MGSLGPFELILILLYVLVGMIVGPLLVGKYADSKGHSFALFFLISFVATPILGFIVALVAPESRA